MIAVFLTVVLLVLGGGVVFLAHRLAFAPKWPLRGVRWVIVIVLVVLTSLVFLGFGSGPTFLAPGAARPLVWVGATWLALGLYLMMGLGVLAVVSVLTGRDRRVRVNRVGVAVVVVLALAVTGAGLARAANPVVTPVEFAAADLPVGFDGVRVALVTDLHAGPLLSAAFTAKVVERVNAASPDLVVFSGDLIDGPVDRFGPELAPIAGLRAPLGVYAVTGNHEMFSGTIDGWQQRWGELGVTVVSNAVVAVEHGGDRIWLGGLHDETGAPPHAPDHAAAVAGAAPDDFLLLVAHQPRAALSMDPHLVDVQLSGHTHGGQLWPFRYAVLAQQPMVDGRARVNGIEVITSRGAGTWGPPVRIGADPEIPLITVRRAATG